MMSRLENWILLHKIKLNMKLGMHVYILTNIYFNLGGGGGRMFYKIYEIYRDLFEIIANLGRGGGGA